MISIFGGLSILVFVLCVAGLVLHHRVMKRRWRLDAAEEQLDDMESSEDYSSEEYDAALREHNEAQTDYADCVSRFPGNWVAKLLHLP